MDTRYRTRELFVLSVFLTAVLVVLVTFAPGCSTLLSDHGLPIQQGSDQYRITCLNDCARTLALDLEPCKTMEEEDAQECRMRAEQKYGLCRQQCRY